MTHALFASMISKHIWNNTNYYEASPFTATAELLKCDLLPPSDKKARDLMHRSKESARDIALCVYNKLKL